MSVGSTTLIAFIAAGALIYAITEKRTDWMSTTAGAIHLNSYDYIEGKISINTAYNQDGVCKDYVNDLNDSNTGIGGAVEDPNQYANFNYYYYKTSSYIQFYKDGQVGFTLTLSTSPIYFKQPRIEPDKNTLLNNLPNLSIGQQIQIANALKDSQGNPKEFTAGELADLIKSIAGQQSFDLTQWVISNLFDQNEQTFMSCVPDINKISENPYGTDQATQMTNDLENAEKTMQRTIDGANGGWLSNIVNML